MSSQIVLNKKGVLTLKEASDITGLNIQTLRSRIKRGTLKGFKKGSQFGEAWYIKADSIEDLIQPFHGRLNVLDSKPENSSPESSSQGVLKDAEFLIQTKTQEAEALFKLSSSLEKQNNQLNDVLTMFQQRIMVLEDEKAGLESKLRLLPAPPELIVKEMEDKTAALAQAEKILEEAKETQKQYAEAMEQLRVKLQEEEHAREAYRIQWEAAQAELNRPWWQKIWRKR
jgi:chromosome segregation ATPase